MRPRGPSFSSPRSRYVGQVAVQKPQCTHFLRMASASMPSGVSLMKSARAVCISEFSSQVQVHAAAVEDALRIELALELLVYLHERRRKRLKHPDRLVAAPKERSVPAGALRRLANGARVGVRMQPAQGPAPLDQLLALKLERRRGRGDRDAPQRCVVPEKPVGLLTNPGPEAFGGSSLDEPAAELFPRRLHRRRGARKPDP